MSKAKKYLRKKYEVGGGTGYKKPDDTEAKAEALKTSTSDRKTVDVSNAPIEKGTGVAGENLASQEGQDTTPVQQSTASTMETAARPTPPEKVDDPGEKPVWSGARRSGSPWERYQLKLQNWNNANRRYQTYLTALQSYTEELNEYLANQGEDVLGDSSGGGAAGEGGGQVDTTGPVTTTESVSGAPVGITQKTPEYITPEVEVATTGASTSVPDAPDPANYTGGRTSGDYKKDLEAWNKEFGDAAAVQAATLSGKEDIQTIGEAGTVTTEGVTATKTVAEAPDPANYPGGETSSKYKEDLAAWEASGGLPGTMAAPDEITGPIGLTASKYVSTQAEMAGPIDAAEGEVSEEAVAKVDDAELTEKAKAAERDDAAEKEALADETVYDISKGAYVNKVTGEKATVEEAEAAEAQTRKLITDDTLSDGKAAEIIGKAGFEAAQRRTVKGTAAKGAAAEMLAEVGELPPEITAAIVEDPATVEAAIDEQPVEVRAAVAALPTEALVSSQMESLLGGLEDGKTPAWARPALAAVEANLAKRGMSASSVGRDAMFNAIIQSAMPIAQANAQALQQRASQNLGNEQQANMSTATLDMQRRLSNLSNQQTANSQTAQMAQQMATMQSQFRQDAVMTTAQMQQQTRMQNLANRQEAAKVTAMNEQAMRAQNLGNEQQIELAEMQYMNATESENMSAIQQERLAEMQTAADFLSKNAGFKQQMELANLSNDQQMKLANLTSRNQFESENLNAAQQTELANLNNRMQTNLLQGKIAAEMNQAQLTVDQQRAVQNASMVANVDLNSFTAAQQIELANSKFMQTMVATKFSADQQAAIQNATALASLDMANLDKNTKLAAQNAQSFLQMDMANLSNEQQAVVLQAQQRQQTLLTNQAADNAAKQFGAANQQQSDQFIANLSTQIQQQNVAANQAREQFNATEKNRMAAIDAGNQLQADQFTSQMEADVAKFNEAQDFQRDQWNAANAQAVEQSNIQWRRQSNLVDTAAQNAANQQNAQMSYNLTSQELTQLWQQLRDEAAYVRQSYENEQQRKAQLLATAIGNEQLGARNASDAQTWLDTVLNT